eukprot:COSAG02_NODE_1195_length_13940_cov_15.482407_10_plen_77_part_00
MLDVELPADLMAQPDTPSRKKGSGATRVSGGGQSDEGEPPRRLTVQELHARHDDSSDDSGDDAFDDLPAGDVATDA